jgi:beta-glucanase (GH16 family)/PKD repeat protein
MKKNLTTKAIFTLIAFVLIVPTLTLAQCSQLVWSDEFNGTALDLNKWSYQIGNGTNDGLTPGWGNQESEYYTSRPENVNVSGGNLVITAKAESYLGANYTSGRIRSRGKGDWFYGSFEARIKVPAPYKDSKAWPGFWMLPDNSNWPYTGEIDVFETGNEYNEWKYNGTLHYYSGAPQASGTGGVTINTTTLPNGDLSNDFHLYRADWTPNSIKFFVDNVQIGATQNNTTTIGGAWPFDAGNKFYLILNIAVNGWFPGAGAPNNARYPLSMLVDYVRVYSTPSAAQITGNAKVLQGRKGVVYSVPAVAGNTYAWTVPGGATIASGVNTNLITVDYGPAATSGNVSLTITPSATGCVASTLSLPVSVVAKQCTMVMEDFEGPATRNLGFNFSTGWMNRTSTTSNSNPLGTFPNPNVVAPNTSNLVGKYERNSGSQYDVLAYNDIVIGNADGYKKGSIAFNMMVQSDAPSGTEVVIQLENRANVAKPWPNGVHSTYTAKTGAPNSWSNLVFTLKDTPDLYQTPDSIDQIVVLFNPNSNTYNTYYFDHFKSVGVNPATTAIIGKAAICANTKNVDYSVTGFWGSTFNWTVPSGASIVSGQGTNAILVNFGSSSGSVTVSESSLVNCIGQSQSLAVSVNPACVVSADFSANKTTTCLGATITYTDKSTATDGSQTYAWNFGSGANPATAATAGPIKVSYSSAGSKNVSLTVTQNGTASTKTVSETITAPAVGCLFNNDYNGTVVSFTSPTNAFSHSLSNSEWNITNAGYGEWENWTYTLNDGTLAKTADFTCSGNKPYLKIRAKASANSLLRIQLIDSNGVETDAVPSFNMELTTSYQTFFINYSGFLYNKYGCKGLGCGPLDSSIVKTLRFFVNPGYTSYPFAGKNKTYNTAFTGGTVTIDWIGMGDNCSQIVTGINSTSLENSISTYPNPAQGELNIRMTSDLEIEANLSITNSLSQEVARVSHKIIPGENNFSLPISHLENGLYFLNIRSGNQSETKRFSILK